MHKTTYAIITYDCYDLFLKFLSDNDISYSEAKISSDYGMFGIECQLSPVDITAIELAIGNNNEYKITTDYVVLFYT